MNRTLVIMAKAPRVGSVKTRLAESIPVLAVSEFYRCLLNDTIALAHELDSVDVAIMCPAFDVEDLSREVADRARVVPQTGDGLAAGLTSVFEHFAANGHKRVIAFNSDSPHLPVGVLEAAFDWLTTRDLVVGPTHDGGYYLIGAKASHPGLFANDGMGTASALQALRERASKLGLSMGAVEPFYDVDVPADLSRLEEELRLAPGKAPRTAAWLAEWRRGLAESGFSVGAP